MNSIIAPRTEKNRGDCASLRTSRAGMSGNRSGAGGVGVPAYSESGRARYPSWMRWTLGRSAASNSCVRHSAKAICVGTRKVRLMPSGTVPSHDGPAMRKSPPALPFVRGLTYPTM